jgi:hypothetical protein
MPGITNAHAVIVIGSMIVPDDLAADGHRVGKKLAHCTKSKKKAGSKAGVFVSVKLKPTQQTLPAPR